MAFAQRDHSAFDCLPDHTVHGRQFLYAIQLCNGIVKVGRTWNPKARMKALSVLHGRSDGKRIVRLAISQTSCPGSKHNEAELIARLRRIASPVRRTREYFSHCHFGQAVTLLRQIAAREIVTASRYAQGQRLDMWFPRAARATEKAN